MIASAVTAGAQAVMVLQHELGPRQYGMGGAGVALPDAGQGMDWNPALAGMSFPRDRRSLMAAHTWLDIVPEPEIGFSDRDAPVAFEAGPLATPFAAYPGWYQPGVGYAGLDRQEFRVDGTEGYGDYCYGLTLATAPDFLLPPGYRSPAWWEWTFGVTVKWFESDVGGGYSASGPALDVGGAWRIARIPGLPGVQAVAGAALANLGAPVFYFDARHADPLPEQWRLGWSLAWRPFAPADREGNLYPLRVTVTQEIRRGFHGYAQGRDARVFPGSLLHDLFRRPGEAWRGRSTHMGAEAILAGTLSARLGRLRDGTRREFSEDCTAYAWGYGIASGPWLGPRWAVSYDFARFFRTESLPGIIGWGTRRQESLQVRLSW